MQDEKNTNNQPVILNLTPVNDNISQFIQLQTGILSESEIYIPSDSILPTGTRIKIEYRLKSFGQKENVKIIDAVGEVIGPEVDSEKGRRGVRAKFLKLSPTSQVLIQKLLEKIKSAKPQSGEKKVSVAPISEASEPKVKVDEPDKTVEPKVKIEEPKVEVQKPKVTISEPKVEISDSPVSVADKTPAFAEAEATHSVSEKKEEPEAKAGSFELNEIMAKEAEKLQSGEIRSPDDKQAQYVFEYLPPGQPLEENTGIVKLREIVRSADVSSMRRRSWVWIVILILIAVIGGGIGFIVLFPEYAPKIFVKSREVSSVITKRDLTPENIQTSVQIPAAKEEKVEKTGSEDRQEREKAETEVEAKVDEKVQKEEKEVKEAQEEKVPEPEIQPLTSKEEGQKKKKVKGVKIITRSKLKKEEEMQKKIVEEKQKRLQEEKTGSAQAQMEAEKPKAKKETAPAEPGKIIIQITPTDADLVVYIDGAQAGTMPTLSKQLVPGVHKIKVVADGYQEEIRKIEIGEGETKTVRINLKEK